MKRRRYVIGILLCVTALLQAQDSVKSFDEFFVACVCSGKRNLFGNTRKIYRAGN